MHESFRIIFLLVIVIFTGPTHAHDPGQAPQINTTGLLFIILT